MTSQDPVRIRRAELTDVSALVALNAAAYPDLIEDGVVFSADQLRAHIERFPQGQLVAEVDGELAGAIATLIPPSNIDVLGKHTWIGITDGGYFTRHDPQGRTLYLADIYVAEAFWGRGVGQRLYAALLGLCRELGLDRVVAGGRLWGYSEVADEMTAREYVELVVSGARRDRVLGSQLRAGFVVRGLLRDYLHDWRSRNWATLLEMPNPDKVARGLESGRTSPADGLESGRTSPADGLESGRTSPADGTSPNQSFIWSRVNAN
jgi:ribosomal protein S18 acetylase RimI-like enzyme